MLVSFTHQSWSSVVGLSGSKTIGKEAGSDPNDPSVLGLVVHSYLKAGGYDDCAKRLAVILNPDVSQELQGLTLVSYTPVKVKQLGQSESILNHLPADVMPKVMKTGCCPPYFYDRID